MPTGSAVEVTSFSWSAFFVLVAAVINGSALTYWIKTRPNMRKLGQDADERLRDDLIARVQTLESTVDRLHAKLDHERAEYDALMSIMRHRVNNSRAALKAIVMMLRVNPDKVAEALDQIEAMMAEQEAAEREEKAALDRAKLAAAAIKEANTC